jgi:hypothetical protein
MSLLWDTRYTHYVFIMGYKIYTHHVFIMGYKIHTSCFYYGIQDLHTSCLFFQILAEELVRQLIALENNENQYYNPKTFLVCSYLILIIL